MIDTKVIDSKEKKFYVRLIITLILFYITGTMFYKAISPFHNCIRSDSPLLLCSKNAKW